MAQGSSLGKSVRAVSELHALSCQLGRIISWTGHGEAWPKSLFWKHLEHAYKSMYMLGWSASRSSSSAHRISPVSHPCVSQLSHPSSFVASSPCSPRHARPCLQMACSKVLSSAPLTFRQTHFEAPYKLHEAGARSSAISKRGYPSLPPLVSVRSQAPLLAPSGSRRLIGNHAPLSTPSLSQLLSGPQCPSLPLHTSC